MVGSSSSELIRLANEEVSIYTVLSKIGVEYQGYYGTTSKLYCPFGYITHIDGGQSKAMRVYPDTNSLFCFACNEHYTPVKLFAAYTDLDWESAAEVLLTDSGWVPETYEEKWDKLIEETKFNPEETQIALDNACRRIDPLWNVHATFDPYKSAYQRCLQGLTQVVDIATSIKWLEESKEIMYEVINANR